jgi:hypothetical protein
MQKITKARHDNNRILQFLHIQYQTVHAKLQWLEDKIHD